MLILQDPTNNESTTLLESVSEALDGAKSLSGAFSFVSSSGVELLEKEENFAKLAKTGQIDLIIGVDAVTNADAIDSLVKLLRRFPGITLRALMNPKPSGMFHPKFAFTESLNGGYQIIGSGNLTEGGLLRHWEAFSFEELGNTAIAATKSTFVDWTKRHASSLLPIDDPQVRQRAAKNTVAAIEGDIPTLVAAGQSDGKDEDQTEDKEPDTKQAIPDGATVLIAQIPSSGERGTKAKQTSAKTTTKAKQAAGRWKQANFDKDNFENFFGVGDDYADRLWVFRHVSADGKMAEYERPRPPVSVTSSNFRFELAAATGLAYPNPETEGRPIGVFVRLAARLYLYRLLMPNDSQYNNVLNLLQTKAGPDHPARNMMRERMSARELKTLWPESPLWKLPSVD